MDRDMVWDIESALRFGLGRDDLADAFISSLDAAWAEAEAALPEGWRMGVHYIAEATGRYAATAGDPGLERRGFYTYSEVRDTPAAALRALRSTIRGRIDS